MSRIGPYDIIEEIGRGGMGVVFRAVDPMIGRPVAVKTIRLDNLIDPKEKAWLHERLFREAQSAGILSHPNIVTIYQIAEQEDTAYIAMEFVGGPNLDLVLSSGTLLERDALLKVVTQIAAALDYAHAKGIVHRDIKPANILFSENGDVKVTDFGIAKLSLSERSTRTGLVVGTPFYMSPEQIQGKPVDGRADQFSLAVIVFAMLTGEKPFDADSLTALAFKIVYEEPAPAVGFNPTLSLEIQAALLKALAKNPASRFATCAEFSQALAGACAAAKGWRPMMPRSRVLSSPVLDKPADTPLAPTMAYSGMQNCPECQAVLPPGLVYCGYCGMSLKEAAARAEERRKAEEERRKIEAEQRLVEARRKAEEERLRIEAEQRRVEEQRKAEEERRRIEAEQRLAQEQRKAEEERRRIEAEQRRAEERRKAEEARRRIEAEQRRAEEQRKAEEERKWIEAEQRQAEERRRAEEDRRRIEAEEKLAAEEERKRIDAEQKLAADRRKAEEELKRIADEQRRVAEERRRAEEERKKIEVERRKAEAKRLAEEQRQRREEKAAAREVPISSLPASDRQAGGAKLGKTRMIVAASVVVTLAAGFGLWRSLRGGAAEASLPVIQQFVATPESIHAGETARLSWSVQGANRVTIDHGVGEVTPRGNSSVTPAQTTTYELNAFGRNGTTSAKALVLVNSTVRESHVTASLTATPPRIDRAGRPVVLSWDVAGATGVSIDHGIGRVRPSGRRTMQPKESTTYLLTAQGPAGAITQSATVAVGAEIKVPVAPPAITFWAEPTAVAAGENTTIHWDVRNATGVTLRGTPRPMSGSETVAVSEPTTLLLIGVGPGGTNKAEVKITVKAPAASTAEARATAKAPVSAPPTPPNPPNQPAASGATGSAPGAGGGGVIGGIIGSVPAVAPPSAAPAVKSDANVLPQRIRVGGTVQAAKLIRQPKPVYPQLAKQARISGHVILNTIIDKDGTIERLTVASGHPLLVPAAMDAVKQWVYAPTLLNGEPVEVVTQIDVNFTLSGDIDVVALRAGQVGRSYQQDMRASGDMAKGAQNWSLVSGDMPPGLTLNASTGSIAGRPSKAGDYNFSLRVSNGAKGTTAAFSMHIAAEDSSPGITYK